MKRREPFSSGDISFNRKSENLDAPIIRIKDCVIEPKEKKRMYSLRLKVKTVDAIKRKAADIGVPYQTLVNTILDSVAKS